MSDTYFYVYRLKYGDDRYIGFGITKNPTDRHRVHLRNFEAVGVICESYATQVCASRRRAKTLESQIKKRFIGCDYLDVESFRKESIPIEHLDEFRRIVSSFDFTHDYGEPWQDLGTFDRRNHSSNKNYYRAKRIGVHLNSVHELAFEQTFEPEVAYKNLKKYHILLAELKTVGIGRSIKKDLEALLKLYKLLGVTEPHALLVKVTELVANGKL